MRFLTLLVVLSYIVVVPGNAQTPFDFGKKEPLSSVKTECFIQFEDIDGVEHLEFFDTRYYSADGELARKSSKQGEFSSEFVYTHKFDKDGRVVRRTETETMIWGDKPPHVRPTRVWEYSYDDAGAATVTCKEVEGKKEENPDDPNPVKERLFSETWQLDASGRALRYSWSLGDKEQLREVYERDKNGKLLIRAEYSGEIMYNRESFTYRDDGTLKESDELVSFTGQHIKKQYDQRGEEVSGAVSDKDGNVGRRWVIDRDFKELVSSETGTAYKIETTTSKIYKKTFEKMTLQIRYVVTTKIDK